MGNYWWRKGLYPVFKKTENPFTRYNGLISAAPTYNLESVYK
jgi:hypothetical protein